LGWARFSELATGQRRREDWERLGRGGGLLAPHPGWIRAGGMLSGSRGWRRARRGEGGGARGVPMLRRG
jgi:hypothetical protein